MKSLPIVGAANYAWRGLRLLEGFVARRPIHAIVQVSNRCNLTCSFCSFWERPAARADEMTLADFEIISAKLAEAGAMIVSLEGGEPTLRPDIAGIVRAFASYHHPNLFTHGGTMTPLHRPLERLPRPKRKDPVAVANAVSRTASTVKTFNPTTNARIPRLRKAGVFEIGPFFVR